MKTQTSKIATFILAGILCFTAYSASAHRYSRHYRARHYHYGAKKLSSKALANMKIKNIEFGFNNAAVPDNAQAALDNVAKLMADNNASLKLGGYADNKGGYVYNWKLSAARAQSVKAYLVSKGADSSRIAATEFGYTHPIASNKTAAGRKKNRRVEVHFAE